MRMLTASEICCCCCCLDSVGSRLGFLLSASREVLPSLAYNNGLMDAKCEQIVEEDVHQVLIKCNETPTQSGIHSLVAYLTPTSRNTPPTLVSFGMRPAPPLRLFMRLSIPNLVGAVTLRIACMQHRVQMSGIHQVRRKSPSARIWHPSVLLRSSAFRLGRSRSVRLFPSFRCTEHTAGSTLD